jgi:hypothetical protein
MNQRPQPLNLFKVPSSEGSNKAQEGGATTTIRLAMRFDLDHQRSTSRQGGACTEEEDRSQPLDLSTKDRESSDPGKLHEG